MKKLLILCLAIALLPLTSAAQTKEEKAQILKGSGFVDLSSVSFEESKALFTVTGMYRSDKDDNPDIYALILVPEREGFAMAFQVNKTCELASRKNRVVLVNGQKVNTVYQCRANSDTGKRVMNYLVLSPEAHNFIALQFLKSTTVVVELDHVTAPFLTAGFAAARARASGKAL